MGVLPEREAPAVSLLCSYRRKVKRILFLFTFLYALI